MSTNAEPTSVTGDPVPHSMSDLEAPVREVLGEMAPTPSIAYIILRQSTEPMSSTDVANIALRGRRSIHRALQKLNEVGLVDRHVNGRGHAQYVWAPVPLDELDTDR